MAVRLRFWRREVICQEWVELVTAYLEGALPRSLTRAIDRHLAGCVHCHEYLDQMRLTIALTGRIADGEVPTDVLDALQRAVDEATGGRDNN